MFPLFQFQKSSQLILFAKNKHIHLHYKQFLMYTIFRKLNFLFFFSFKYGL